MSTANQNPKAELGNLDQPAALEPDTHILGDTDWVSSRSYSNSQCGFISDRLISLRITDITAS